MIPPPPPIRSSAARYLVAAAIATAGELLRWALFPLFGHRFAFIQYFPAIGLAAWLGGFGPGLFTMALSAAAVALIRPGLDITDSTNVLAMAAFLVDGVILAVLAESVRRGRRRAEVAHEELLVTLRSIGDGVIVTDPHGRVTFLNPVAAELTGWTDADAVGREIEDVFHIVTEGTTQVPENPVRRVLRERVAVELANHTCLRSRSGGEVPIDDSAAPIRAADETLVGVVLVFRDDSKRRAAVRALEEGHRLKDDFLATLSHELRTPLNAMLGWLQMLTAGQVPAERMAHVLEVVRRNAEAQRRLVDDLLDLSAISTGRLRLELRMVDVNRIVRETVDAVRPAAVAKGVQLRADLADTCGTVRADAVRLQQVVWNLLWNAIKFTPRDGTIDIATRRAEGGCEIEVRDTGEGIAPGFLPFVFDAFRQDPDRQHGRQGLGLGLSIVRHVVEAHGGRVAASSEGPGRGAQFTVVLPANTPAADPVTT